MILNMEEAPKQKNTPEIIPFSEEEKRLRDKLNDLSARASSANTSDEDFIRYMNEKAKFEAELLERHPNARKYKKFHILIGSTMYSDMEIIYDDFSEDESVEKFINSLAVKYFPDPKQ